MRTERQRVLRFLKLQAKTGFGLDRNRGTCSKDWLARERRHADYEIDFQESKDCEEAKRHA